MQFFGNAVELDCHLADLKLVLRRTEEIEFPDHAKEEDKPITDIHPDITRKAFIVTQLIELDDQLKIFCNILKNVIGQELRWNDLKGSALERFVAYCEKACGLKPICNEASKQILIGLIEIRNCIVHNNSSLDGFSKATVVQGLASQVEGISIDEGYITLEVSGCTNCADIVESFMDHAYRVATDRFPDQLSETELEGTNDDN